MNLHGFIGLTWIYVDLMDSLDLLDVLDLLRLNTYADLRGFTCINMGLHDFKGITWILVDLHGFTKMCPRINVSHPAILYHTLFATVQS